MRFPAAARMLVFVTTVALGGTGCVQENQRIVLNPDGSGKFTSEIQYDARVLARFAEGMGRSPEEVRGMLPDVESLLDGIIEETRGVDVWSEARIETDSTGKHHIYVGGYFKDLSKFSLRYLAGEVNPSARLAPDPGIGRLRKGEAGTLVLDLKGWLGSPPDTGVAEPLPAMTADERSRLDAARMTLSVATSMMATLAREAHMRTEYVVPGEIVDAGRFTRSAGNAASAEMSYAKLASVTSELLQQNDDLARRLILGDSAAAVVTRMPAVLADPTVQQHLALALFGSTAPARIVFRPGRPQFDYAAERRYAAEHQPPLLAALRQHPRRADGEQNTSRSAVDVDRPEWGYALKGAADGWRRLDPVAAGLSPLADLVWTRDDEAIAVVPLRFTGTTPDLPALARGLLSLLGIDYPNGGSFQPQPWPGAPGEGLEIRTETTGKAGTFLYRLRVARGRKAAWLVAGWYLRDQGDPKRVQRTLDAVALHEPRGKEPALSDAQRVALALALNGAGLSYFDRRSYRDALQWFRAAFDLVNTDPDYLGNTSLALRACGDTTAALALLSRGIGGFPERADLHLLLAKLLLDTAQPDSAHRSFLAAIRLGTDDESELVSWLQRMIGLGHDSLAIADAAAWVAKYPGAKPRRWHAECVRESGDLDGALLLFRGLATSYPDDEGIAADLGSILNFLDQPAEAADIAQKFMSTHGEDAALLTVLGQSQLARNWYRDARATFERAARLAPDDEEIVEGLRAASSMLGQSTRSDIQEPIDPVPLPAALERALAVSVPADFGRGYPAFVLREVHGHLAQRGKPARYTLRYRVKVLSQEGAAKYGSLEWSFRPGSQRAFINRLEVRNEEGQVVSSVAPADAYVIDDREDPTSDDKMLHVQVRGVTPGTVIDGEVTFEERSADTELEYTRHLLAARVPTATAAVYLAGDTAGVRAAMRNSRNVTVLRGDRFVAWIARPVPIVPEEAMASPPEEWAPIVSLCGPDSSWATAGDGYLSDLRDILEPDATIAQLSARLVAGARTRRDSVAALARYVQQQINYKAVEFGRRARRPDPPAQVVAQRFGDCKDHAVLLHQLLAAADIPSRLALVNSTWRIEPTLPSLDQFDHMVVEAPALGDGFLIDPTEKYVRLDTYPAYWLHRSHVLVLDPAGSRLQPPRAELPAEGYVLRCRRSVVPEGADWRVDETVTAEGYTAMWFRNWLAAVDAPERLRRFQDFLGSNAAVQVNDLAFDGLEDSFAPLVAEIHYTVKAAVTSRSGRASAEVPAFIERAFLVLPFLKERRTPVEVRFPLHLESSVTVRLPGAGAAVPATSPQHVRNEFCAWDLSAAPGAREGDLTLQLDLHVLPGDRSAGSYAGMVDALLAPLHALARHVDW